MDGSRGCIKVDVVEMSLMKARNWAQEGQLPSGVLRKFRGAARQGLFGFGPSLCAVTLTSSAQQWWGSGGAEKSHRGNSAVTERDLALSILNEYPAGWFHQLNSIEPQRQSPKRASSNNSSTSSSAQLLSLAL